MHVAHTHTYMHTHTALYTFTLVLLVCECGLYFRFSNLNNIQVRLYAVYEQEQTQSEQRKMYDVVVVDSYYAPSFPYTVACPVSSGMVRTDVYTRGGTGTTESQNDDQSD